jgi:hypothetical protein
MGGRCCGDRYWPGYHLIGTLYALPPYRLTALPPYRRTAVPPYRPLAALGAGSTAYRLDSHLTPGWQLLPTKKLPPLPEVSVMRPLPAAIAITLAAIAAHPALGQDRIPKVEYQAGHVGMEKKVKGSLVISNDEVQFLDEKGNTRITMPMTSITGVSSSDKEGLVTVAYEAVDTAEGVIFKTQKNVSAGAVAKIQFHMKQSWVAVAPDSTAVAITGGR